MPTRHRMRMAMPPLPITYRPSSLTRIANNFALSLSSLNVTPAGCALQPTTFSAVRDENRRPWMSTVIVAPDANVTCPGLLLIYVSF